MTSAILLATVTHWAVPAMSEVMRLPETVPEDGEKGGVVRIVAAKDEYEPGSFVVRSDTDLGKVRFELSAFTNAAGQALPPAQLDLKFVKVWYQNRNGWFNYFGDTGFKLIPELLVNDEDLIRVDTAGAANYARLVEADGTVREQWLNPPRQMDKRPHPMAIGRNTSVFHSMAPNFRDAKTLQPVALPANASKQFILTVHATKETPAGLYCGSIALKKGRETEAGRRENQTILSVPVAIRVLDFTLPRPAPYDDPDGDFPIAFYSYDDIDHVMALNGCDRALAVKQLLAVRRDQVAHGQSMITFKTDFGDIEDKRGEVAMQAGLMKKAGMRTDFFIGGVTVNGAKGKMREVAARKAAKMDELFGHHNCYVAFGDEPGSDWLAKVREHYESYHDSGFGFFIAGDDNVLSISGEFVDWINLAQRPESARQKNRVDMWRKIPGARCGWYGQMHVGPENPAFNRRQNGLAPYLSGYNCFCNYAHHFGPYNDDSSPLKPMVFAYGSYDGVIDTIQWEGFREGVDDMRYATAMVRLARKAAAAKDRPSVVRAGRRAMRLLAMFDRERGDCAALRGEMIRHIQELRGLVGEIPADRPLAQIDRDADELIARYDVNQPSGFYEKAVGGHFAEAVAELDKRTDWRLHDSKARAAVAAYWAVGRGAELPALVAKIAKVSFAWELRPAVATNLAFAAQIAADPSDAGIARTLAAFPGLRGKAQTGALDLAGQLANWIGREELVRRLWKVREGISRRPPVRTMDVAYTAQPMLGPESWRRAGLTVHPQKMDRAYGDANMAFMMTDIATGNRGLSAKDAEKKSLDTKPTFSAVCDDWGVHLRFVEKNPDTAKIYNGVSNGGSWEIYLASADDQPHSAFIYEVRPDAKLDLYKTAYETYPGYRHLKDGEDSTRAQLVFNGDGTIETFISVAWENYAGVLDAAESGWEFEALRWGNAGSSAWNGTESIHGRSTWGRLRFALPADARARIARRLLSKAVASYRLEKASSHWKNGCFFFWKTPGVGDAAFYAAEVAPLEKRLDEVCAKVDAGLSDDAALALARRELAEMTEVEDQVARKRAAWLLRKAVGDASDR